MSLLDGFLRDILDHPDDDSPRLILADWLEDHGAPNAADRAELLRVQCRLAKMAIDDEERPTLEARQMSLLHGPVQGWATPLRPFVRDWTFHRGLVGEVSIEAARLPTRARELFRHAPVQKLTLLHLEDSARQVADLPELSRIRGLGLGALQHDWGATAQRVTESSQSLSTLLGSPYLTELRELAINQRLLSTDAWNQLARSAWPAGLEVLDVRNTHSSAVDLAELLQPSRLPRLHTLRLGETTVHTLRAGRHVHEHLPFSTVVPMLPRLRHLEADGWPLPDLLRHIPASAEPCLRTLTLRYTFSDPQRHPIADALGQLLAMRWLSKLRCLDLRLSNVSESGALALANAPSLSGLTELVLNGALLGPKGAGVLANSPHFGRLWRLELHSSAYEYGSYRQINRRVEDGGVAALAASEAFPSLRFLNLRDNRITNTGLRAIRAAPWLPQLHLLDLRQNQVDDQGANLLLEHGPWPALARLDLRNNQITSRGKQALRACFGDRVWY